MEPQHFYPGTGATMGSSYYWSFRNQGAQSHLNEQLLFSFAAFGLYAVLFGDMHFLHGMFV